MLQPIHLDDVVESVQALLQPGAPARCVLDLVGARAWRFDELVGLFRRWLGWRPARTTGLPRWLAALTFAAGDVLAWLGWRSALRSTAAQELLHAAPGNPGPWMQATGIQPIDMERMMLLNPAPVQERWFARLYLLRPWIFVICALFWIVTGIVSLGPGWQVGIGLMNEGGVYGGPAAAVVVTGALCDIVVGMAIGWRRSAAAGVIAGIAVTIAYALVGTALLPRLWSDPLGAMLKILPILALHLAALAIVEDR